MSELPQKIRETIAAADLPALPHVLLKLLRSFNSERANVGELSRLINLDRALRFKILALAGARGDQNPAQIIALEQSLIALGLDTVRVIIIRAAAIQVFRQQAALTPADAKRLWLHAALAAMIARMLADMTQAGRPEEAYLAGLLHDIGQLALLSGFPDQYASILSEADERRQLELEQQRFGAKHNEIGFWLINHYRLRSIVADALLYHHEPAERIEDAHALVRIVNAAHLLSSDSAEEAAAGVAQTARMFRLAAHEVLALVERARQKVQQDAEYLGLDLEKGKAAQDGSKRKKSTEPDAPDTDRLIDAQLAEEVRNIVLLSGVRQTIAAATGEQAMLCAIGKSAQILFGVPSIVFFIHEPGSNLLLGRSVLDENAVIDQIAVPLDSQRSVIAKAVRAAAPLDSFSQAAGLAIIDEQVIRVMGKDGILCAPMIVADKTLGAMVLGLSANHAAALRLNAHFITAFANLAARSFETYQSRQAYEKFIEANQEAEYANQSRKIVHEVSNPLSIIKNYIKILGMKLGADDPAQQDLDVLNEEIARVVDIVRTLSDPRRPMVDMTREADPNLVISEVVDLCEKSLFVPHRITLVLELDQSIQTIPTDKNGVKQILLNLVKNAAEAMTDGGTLTISTAGGVNRDGAEYVEIRVADTGPGIPPPIMSRLFEPVTSNKGNGHAGLGLAIVKNIVKDLRGFITCRNSGNGASFEILLPKNPPLSGS